MPLLLWKIFLFAVLMVLFDAGMRSIQLSHALTIFTKKVSPSPMHSCLQRWWGAWSSCSVRTYGPSLVPGCHKMLHAVGLWIVEHVPIRFLKICLKLSGQQPSWILPLPLPASEVLAQCMCSWQAQIKEVKKAFAHHMAIWSSGWGRRSWARSCRCRWCQHIPGHCRCFSSASHECSQPADPAISWDGIKSVRHLARVHLNHLNDYKCKSMLNLKNAGIIHPGRWWFLLRGWLGRRQPQFHQWDLFTAHCPSFLQLLFFAHNRYMSG